MSAELLRKIEEACQRHGVASATFGRDAVGDPRLVFDLRRGRQVREKTRIAIETYIATMGSQRT